MPLWFVEGMAEYLTLGPGRSADRDVDAGRGAAERLPAIKDLASPRYFPYRWGAALWAHLVERFGADLPARALRAKRDVKRRLLDGHRPVARGAVRGLARGARERMRRRAAPASPALISSRRGGGRLNLAASLSPDGRRMVFLSERDQFSIDLFLADAVTGRIIRSC